MGWYISHGGTRHGYSYSGVAELRDKLQKAAPAEWSALAAVLKRPSGDPFELDPVEAERVGHALHRAADRLHVWDRNWTRMARQIADSALLAARLGEPWMWS
ncbi:hypothetical protein [Streptomyces sp. NPDC012888]|uniref:DUF7739 domain-containing protein n=1 Tax=Streptomyces sp. NPDC012888 TaxID=3364855 RepID=UPI003695E2C8